MAIGLGRACRRPPSRSTSSRRRQKGKSQPRLPGSRAARSGCRGAAERNARDRGRAPHRPDAWGVEVRAAGGACKTRAPDHRARQQRDLGRPLGGLSGRRAALLVLWPSAAPSDAFAASSSRLRGCHPLPACRRSAGARVWRVDDLSQRRRRPSRSDGAPRRQRRPPSPGRIHARNKSIPINGWYRAHPHTAQMLAAISSRPARQFRAVCCRRCSPSRRNERIASGTPEEGTLRPWS